MIQISSTYVQLRQSDGQDFFYNLDELRCALDRHCRQLGVKQPDLLDDLLELLRVYTRETQLPALTRPDLERLVARLLIDAGQRELAEAYLAAVPGPAGSPSPGPQLDCTPANLRQALAGDPFFLAKPRDEILPPLLAAIQQLGLRQVSETLVLELARHLWCQRPNPAPAGYWLLETEEIDQFLCVSAPLWGQSALRVRPVSQLAPMLHLRLDLLTLAGSEPTELFFFRAFERAAAELRQTLDLLRQEIRQRLAWGPAVGVHAALRCQGLAALGRQLYGSDCAAAAALPGQVQAILHHELHPGPATRIYLE